MRRSGITGQRAPVREGCAAPSASAVSGLEGRDGMLEAIRWRRRGSSEEARRPVRHLFLFIGAAPNTDWLAGSGVALDAKGFVLTVTANVAPWKRASAACWPSATCGRIRPSGSGAAIGEGAQVVATLHAFLAEREPAIR
jgi:thioredoxin reductase (NADPH)